MRDGANVDTASSNLACRTTLDKQYTIDVSYLSTTRKNTMEEKVLHIDMESTWSVGFIKNELEELRGKKGKLTTSPLVCCLMGLIDEIVEDPEDATMAYKEGRMIRRFGYFGDVVIYRDCEARENYFRFEESLGV